MKGLRESIWSDAIGQKVKKNRYALVDSNDLNITVKQSITEDDTANTTYGVSDPR